MKKIKIENKSFELFIKSADIQKTISIIATKINRELKNEDVVFICVLNGAFMFASDLLKKIRLKCSVSFLKLSSYKDTESCGSVRKLIGINESLTGKTLVVIEDIVDTGITIENTIKQLNEFSPKEVKIATLLFKPQKMLQKVEIDYIGFTIPDNFVVGFGLDYNGYSRNLKDIYILTE